MATIGVSKPYVAQYLSTNGVISYSRGQKLARAVEFSADIESAENNDLYSDNGISESDRSFSSGTLTITTDDLEQQASALIMGLSPHKLSLNGEEVDELVYDNQSLPPYLGLGIIIKKQKNNQIRWRAIVYPKIMFSIPSDSATTQGETIEWQTPELSASILRDDSESQRWKREATFSSEVQAERYIRKLLNVPELGVLTLTSTAGTDTGETIITAAPQKPSSNLYYYRVGETVGLPDLNEKVDAPWESWNGTDAIIAATGLKIAVVETNADSYAVKGGTTTVTSKEAPLVASLTVVRNNNSRSNSVTLNITPAADLGNTYRYKVVDKASFPSYDDTLPEDWIAWNGLEAIPYESGKQIVVVEVDSEGKAKRAGISA